MASKLTAAAASLSLALAGCASSSDKVAASYVSHHQYQNYSCEQILQESELIRAAALAGGAQLDKAAQNDAGIMAVGLVLFWPAMFFVGGNQSKEAEYARLKGEIEALDRARIEKNCTYPYSSPQASNTAGSIAPETQHIRITYNDQPKAAQKNLENYASPVDKERSASPSQSKHAEDRADALDGLVSCRVGTLAPVITTASKCTAMNGVFKP